MKVQTPECWGVETRLRMVVEGTDRIKCICGSAGRISGEPTNGGSHFYVCSSSGAPLGYSGI